MYPSVSIIVPTLNEARNLPLLMRRIALAMKAATYEVIIVDDNSSDETPQVCAQLAIDFPLELIVRRHPMHGLSGAVLAGMRISRGQTLIVMDGDLQHPPEMIPRLIDALQEGDFVLGSRYVKGASTDQEWGLLRKINSRGATFLARGLVGKVRDPMSGFFALRRETFQSAQNLAPVGYKIALELICKCNVGNVVEVPIHFGTREFGESKLCLGQQLKYLEHLSRLYDYAFPRASASIKSILVGILGWSVGLAGAMGFRHVGAGPMTSTAFGYLGVIVASAIFQLRALRRISRGQRAGRLVGMIWAVEYLLAIAAAGWTSVVSGFTIATVTGYVLRKALHLDRRSVQVARRAVQEQGLSIKLDASVRKAA